MEPQTQQPVPQPEKPKKKFYKKWWFWILISIVSGFILGYYSSLIVWGDTEYVGAFYQRDMGVPLKVGYFTYQLEQNDTRSKCTNYVETSPGLPEPYFEECISVIEEPQFFVLNLLIWSTILYIFFYFIFVRTKNTRP